jgi:hypothetical protein
VYNDTVTPANTHEDGTALVIPAFGQSPRLVLDVSSTRTAEKRLIEAKTVNPCTYADLEHSFNESYRELKRHHATLSYQIALAEKALEEAKAEILLDKYPDFMKDKPKAQDNADMRKAFMVRDPVYAQTLDRINMLKAIESFIEGRIKVMERVSAYMKKQMDLLIRSGLAGTNLHVTSGKK